MQRGNTQGGSRRQGSSSSQETRSGSTPSEVESEVESLREAIRAMALRAGKAAESALSTRLRGALLEAAAELAALDRLIECGTGFGWRVVIERVQRKPAAPVASEDDGDDDDE